MSANSRQVGGDHYKKGGEEHWDRAWRLKYDPFQYIITKWIERWRDKGGIQDLEKAKHAIEKYIELNTPKVVSGPNPLDTVDPDGKFSPAKLAEWLMRVKPTGWEGFTFEGADSGGYHYTCKSCKHRLAVPQFVPPMEAHECGAEPGRGYVQQD